MAKVPAALQRKAKDYPPTVVGELRKIEEALGGRDQVVGMLSLAPLTPDLRYLLGILGDPLHQRKSLAEICALAEVLPGDLLQQLHGAALMLGKVRTAQQVAAGLQPVVADLLRRAAPYEEPCHDCLGSGSVTPDPTPDNQNPGPGPCDTCMGTGVLRYTPELERQKLVLELAQTLPKGGGLSITNNQMNLNAPGGSGGGVGLLDRVQQLADAALYGDGPSVPTFDAEVLPEDPAEPADV